MTGTHWPVAGTKGISGCVGSRDFFLMEDLVRHPEAREMDDRNREWVKRSGKEMGIDDADSG
jgi:hypothetical protein